MRHRLLTRLVRLLTIFTILLGMQMAASMPIAASDTTSMPMPASESPCKDCGKSAIPATQCAAICIFVLIPSGEPVSAAALIAPRLRPTLAAIPASWSMQPETAPPRA